MSESSRVLVVVADSDSLPDTISYALGEAGDTAAEFAAEVTLTVRVPDERTATRVRGLAADLPSGVLLDVVVADPTDAADVAARSCRQALLDTAVPEAVAEACRAAGRSVERVPFARETERRTLRHGAGLARYAATFGLSFGFYLLLGDPTDPFDLVTGALSATLVAALLAVTVFEEPPTPGRTLPRLARATLFVPFLLWEIAKANVDVLRVVLTPSLPIDPRTVTLDVSGRGRFEQALLANAITLTPGTVTVDVDDETDTMLVHTLTEGTRADLEAGRLQRAVGYVFHGRDAGGER